jgi:diguanylate cyclase (GGDEF)-like protein
MIAMNLGASIRRLFLFEKLSEIATIDPLTDILNLRALNDRLTNELSRSNRYEMPLTMLFLDLDKFKSINDNYGHLMGDEVIRETAKIIKSNLRDADILGRYGGEEFVAVLTNTPLKSGKIVAERIVKALYEKVFTYGGQSVKCKISIGASQFPTHGKTINDLIETADAAMYEAKARGGNQVVLYQDI